MARKITVTAAELSALRWLAERTGLHDDSKEGAARMRHVAALLAKAEKAHAPVQRDETAVGSVAQMENALLAGAGVRAAKMGRLTAREYVMLTRDIQERQTTVEDMHVVSLWIRRQAWLRGKVTLDQVLRNWGTWLGRARSEQPRSTAPALLEGFETD
ncbi:MAG: hypothetical protein H0U84_05895 [Thermoleophilaceae bacterium]|nr:hypothetical protein [Thermoleophilaceae bacterium]